MEAACRLEDGRLLRQLPYPFLYERFDNLDVFGGNEAAPRVHMES
jgi:hypothetical protein